MGAGFAEDTDEEDGTLHWCLLANITYPFDGRCPRVFSDWRMRGRIEQGYRFDQEQGLDVET